jgi:hypothetical protein
MQRDPGSLAPAERADGLLDARLARGWSATPSGTVDGEQVLGHAACRVTRRR